MTIFQLTDHHKSWKEDDQSLSVANGLGNGVDENWQISANIIHHKEKDA